MNQRHRLHRNRDGFTLRELSISMGFTSVIMMASVGMVHRAFDWSTTVSHRRSDDQTFFRLSRQMRDDVVLASGVDVQPSNDSESERLTLQQDNEVSVTYVVSDQTITRTEQTGDELKRREIYRWKQPRDTELEFLPEKDLVRLEVRSVFPHTNETVPLWRSVGATVGLRLRYQNGGLE